MKKFIYISSMCVSTALFASTALATPAIHAPQPAANAQMLLINSSDKDIESAKKFVTRVADQGIGFLSDESLTLDERKKAFKKLLSNNFDMKIIARFSLGRYWRTATKAQQNEYLDLFEKMVLNVYARRFGEYSGEKLIVENARPEGKKDILVHSAIAPQNGGASIKVDWRIRTKNGNSKVIDIIVEGVSMSLTQRSDFSSVIQRGGGDIDVLLQHLREQN